MGQYYLPYVKTGNQITVFDNKVDGDYNGLKLMEHSYWGNEFVGNVINFLYHNRSRVCWVGDYYDEDDYYQQNCDDKELVKEIGERVWNDEDKTECHKSDVMTLTDKLLVNHTKKIFIRGNDFFARNKWVETWEGKEYECCINPLPLLTCTASHSGGSYYGVNREECGSWFYDKLEVIDDNQFEINNLLEQGYIEDNTMVFKE